MSLCTEDMDKLQLCKYKPFPDNSKTIWKKYHIKSDGVHYMSRILGKSIVIGKVSQGVVNCTK